MTEALYVLAWQIYAVSALVAILMLWMATRWSWWPVAWLIRANFVVILALPTRVATADQILAPAWVSIIIDKVFTGMPSSAHAQRALLSVIEMTSIAVIVAAVVIFVWDHRKQKQSTNSKANNKVSYSHYAHASSISARRTRGLMHKARLRQAH